MSQTLSSRGTARGLALAVLCAQTLMIILDVTIRLYTFSRVRAGGE
ncbi:hypothetical protein HFP15_04505 [Amycolatopsis sp. K13G38]|uniref:Sugar ABC transporter permease n=1 Tax=Amycolatopsis acididurans TaxID=2724524 RepID=A0ABX1IXU6_9PSEU|nr:hypothetical protein [Amycolatopsis acididurans]NKQ52139.1 hypothetical protein [Amycolatopsis acididurans]